MGGRIGSKEMLRAAHDRKAVETVRLLMGSEAQFQQAVQAVATSPRLMDRIRRATQNLPTGSAVPGMVSGEAMAQGEQR